MKEIFSEKYLKYEKIRYLVSIFLFICLGILKVCESINLIIYSILAIILFYIVDIYTSYFRDKIRRNTIVILRFTELVVYNTFDYFFPDNYLSKIIWTLLIMLSSFVFLLQYTDYDRNTVFGRKILFFVPITIKLLVSAFGAKEIEWFSYALIQCAMIISVFMVVEAMVRLNEQHELVKRNLTIEKSHIIDNNQKLLEYQEKIKVINEQINYQKFDLAKTLMELEQANIEMEAQTELMKYMASTFDVMKCMNFITDNIMEIKKPKLCAIFVDKDVYQNKYSSCIIKTNYSSMYTKLKKDIDKIFVNLSNDLDSTKIYKGEKLKEFRFIGDANINVLGFMPIKENNKMYGMMLLGSDKEEFFEKGTSYYENCIIEFDVSVKSIKMYNTMQDMARKDGLTGIYNRVYNTELFKKVAQDSVSNKKPLSVALMDIDKFKKVNDTYGHIAGDAVIKMVAKVAEKYAEKHNGFACRFGGEEFLLTIPGYDHVAMLEILEHMHNEIKSTVVPSGENYISVNVCIGLSSYPTLCDNPELLVHRADNAMYYAKRHGRGRIIVDNPELNET